MKSFEELDCWKEATKLRRDVSKITKTFPEEEKYKLVDQMLRCSRSVTNNIAEGYGKFHLKDNARFCRMSKGSLNELKDHFIIANDEGYVDLECLIAKREQIDRCIQILNGYVNYLLKLDESRK
jgi:four helix bundle protein